MSLGFSFSYKKGSNHKKESFSYETLKTLTKFTTQTSKSKKENQSFLSRQFCASLKTVGQ
jgi:phage-related minor tail protein